MGRTPDPAAAAPQRHHPTTGTAAPRAGTGRRHRVDGHNRRARRPGRPGWHHPAPRRRLRLGELLDLELDCLWDLPGHAWLKVPLGKLATERVVPLDDATLSRSTDGWPSAAGSATCLIPATDGPRRSCSHCAVPHRRRRIRRSRPCRLVSPTPPCRLPWPGPRSRRSSSAPRAVRASSRTASSRSSPRLGMPSKRPPAAGRRSRQGLRRARPSSVGASSSDPPAAWTASSTAARALSLPGSGHRPH